MTSSHLQVLVTNTERHFSSKTPHSLLLRSEVTVFLDALQSLRITFAGCQASLVIVIEPLIHNVSTLSSEATWWWKSQSCSPSTNTRKRLHSQRISSWETETHDSLFNNWRCGTQQLELVGSIPSCCHVVPAPAPAPAGVCFAQCLFLL